MFRPSLCPAHLSSSLLLIGASIFLFSPPFSLFPTIPPRRCPRHEPSSVVVGISQKNACPRERFPRRFLYTLLLYIIAAFHSERWDSFSTWTAKALEGLRRWISLLMFIYLFLCLIHDLFRHNKKYHTMEICAQCCPITLYEISYLI